jgi:prepilin-type processing-associated H-X9-DG protein
MEAPMRTRPRGVTAVELVVLLAIVGITAAMVWPVILRVRTAAAKQTVCLTNQHRLVTLALLYAQDHADHLPPAATAWEALAPDPRLLVCPTRDVRAAGYGVNAQLDGLALGDVAAHDATLFSADSDTPDHAIRALPDLAPRHNDKFVAAYLDGHVEAYPRNAPITLAPAQHKGDEK